MTSFDFDIEQAALCFEAFADLFADDPRDLLMWELTARNHAANLHIEAARQRALTPHYDHPPIDKYRPALPNGHSLTIDGGTT